jgi:DNA-binding XRE family transcriptional regulator
MISIEHLHRRLKDAPSVRGVAKLSGLSEKTLHRIKSGNLNISIRTANKLASALDLVCPVRKRATTAKEST